MIVPVVVEGQSLRWYGRIPEIADNSIEFVQLEFRLPEDWEGLVIVAQFAQTKTYNCLLVNNRCFLPVELVAGPCEVSAFGYLNKKATRGTTIPLRFNISRSGFVSSAETPIPPTPDLYAQLIEQFSGGKVAYNEEQKLTDEQKELARTNIGAQPAGNYLTEVSEGYAKTEDIPTKPEDIGAQPSGDYALRSEIPNVPVQSVNGKTGVVQLSASDVGAWPDSWMPTANQIGADPAGTALTVVAKHNTAEDSHNDIRLELQAINNRLTAFFDSDEQTLDELSEIVAYITSNKTLIDSITTSKVSVADIINNLTTNVSNKPLSAAQGVILKGMIDTISNNLSNYQPKGDYLTEAQLEPVRKSVEEANQKVDTLRGIVSKFHSNIVETAAGDIITVSDASDMELAGLKVFGKTTQNGTPTPDAPVPLESVGDGGSVGVTVAGKNLIPYPYELTTQPINGITFTDNGDGTVTANGRATANAKLPLFVWKNAVFPAGKYIVSGCPSGGSYFTYRINFAFKDADGSVFIDSVDTGIGQSIMLNKTATKLYLTLLVNAGQTVSNLVFRPQIEIGSTATAYEPYNGQSLTVQKPADVPVFLPGIPVESGGNYTDTTGQQWICDYVDFEKGKYVQNVLDLVLTEDEAWVKSGTYPGSFYFIPKISIERHTKILCSHAVWISRFTNYAIGQCTTDGSISVWLGDDKKFPTLEVWKEWLVGQNASGNPVTVKYILMKPIEHDLIAEELAQYSALHTNYPNTTIFNDGGAGMEVKYVADTKLYVDKKFAELAAAIVGNA